MTPPPSRSRAVRIGVSGLVLVSTVFGAVLVPAAANAEGTGAPPATSPVVAPSGAAPTAADRPTLPSATVTSLHSDVPVTPIGSAADVRAADGTQFARSDLRQAGRWIHRGQSFVVDVPGSVTAAEIGVGQYGSYLHVNDCRDVGIWTQSLHPGRNEVTAPHDGLVSVIDRSTTDTGTVTVRGGHPVPTYVAGRTDRAVFDRQLREWRDAPFLQLVGDRVQADVLRAESTATADQNEELLAGQDLDARIGRWDDIVRTNEAFWGAGRAAHRVHLATPSRGVAGSAEYASPHDGWIGFATDHAAPHGLLTGDSSFGGEQHVRRAIGRVFQQDVTRWRDGFDQVDRDTSADLASIVVEERVNARNHLDSWTSKVQRFRATPIGQRDFWSNKLTTTTRSLMYDQLRRAYGDDVIARIAAASRGDAPERDARRTFVRAAARVTDRDLTHFFQEWGITVEDDLRAELATHPEPETAIWDDFDALH